MLQKIKESTTFLTNETSIKPKAGVILGSGLAGFAETIKSEKRIPYGDIPNFPQSTVKGHKGALNFGYVGNTPIVAMEGRFHYYEGWKPEETIFPVRVMKQLGITHLFLSNAAGGVNPDHEIGDAMIITDHINLIPNPLIGPNDDELGPRFPDMSDAYDPALREQALRIARENKIKVQQGIYLATTGPTYETPAEYQYFRIIGADAVGMSTAPEVIAARQMDIKCFGVSIITDLGVPGKIIEITHEEVIKIAKQAEPKMAKVFNELIGGLS